MSLQRKVVLRYILLAALLLPAGVTRQAVLQSGAATEQNPYDSPLTLSREIVRYDRQWDAFDLPAPRRLQSPTKLWATWYWTPCYRSQGDVPILDIQEQPFGPHLPPERFCHAAVQGAVRIDGQVYTFDELGKTALADCRVYRPDMPQAPYVRFKKSDSPFGEGEEDFRLIPYRSVAVDKRVIPVGSVLYIPQARGIPLYLPDGTKTTHDGYFFAADIGYGVEGTHIDVFLGITANNPFPFISSSPKQPFDAYLVTDPAIKTRLTALHGAPR